MRITRRTSPRCADPLGFDTASAGSRHGPCHGLCPQPLLRNSTFWRGRLTVDGAHRSPGRKMEEAKLQPNVRQSKRSASLPTHRQFQRWKLNRSAHRLRGRSCSATALMRQSDKIARRATVVERDDAGFWAMLRAGFRWRGPAPQRPPPADCGSAKP